MARLLVMRRLTLEGVAPVDAARAALDTEVDALESLARPGTGGGSPAAPPESEPARGARGHLRALPGGGEGTRGTHATSLPGAAPSAVSARVAAVIDAALAYDQQACDALLRVGAQGDSAAWWTQLVEPAWMRIAQRTVLGSPGDEPELVLAMAAMSALRDFTHAFEGAMVEAGNPPANHPSRMRKIVLIFAAPDEVVPLAAHALAAALVAQGATARIVTGPASTHRAVELVTMVRPAALVLATTLARPDLDFIHAINDAFASLPIFVGLRRDDASSEVPLSTNVQRVRSFTGLLHEVLAVVG